MDSKKHDRVQSIHRALTILRMVAKYEEQGLRLSQVARKVKIHVATTRRLLQALTSEGFIKYDRVTKLYTLGSAAYSLCNNDKYQLLHHTYHPSLEAVSIRTKEMSYLLVRLRYDLLSIDRVQGSYNIQIVYDVGMRTPLGIGGAGLAILAASSDQEVEDILKANEERYIQYNDTSLAKIRKAIKLSRKLGFGFSQGLYVKGVNAVGVPILNADDEISGAISVPTFKDRMNQKRAVKVAEIIKEEIAKIKHLSP